MSQTPTPVLHADGVEVVRQGKHLLRGLRLRVEKGEHWVVLGANGAGKSTLMGLLGATLHPTRGTVHVLGRQLGRVDMRELRSLIGHVNPRHRVDSPLTAIDVVLTGLTSTAELLPRRQTSADEFYRAGVLLDQLGMSGRHQLLWPTMSQGERGRVLIARALISAPKVLLLDEPATGLDLASRERLLIAIDRLRADVPDLATVLITHHLEEIPVTTTHAFLLRQGEKISAGPIDSVLTSELISECFDHKVEVSRNNGRWSASAGLRPREQRDPVVVRADAHRIIA